MERERQRQERKEERNKRLFLFSFFPEKNVQRTRQLLQHHQNSSPPKSTFCIKSHVSVFSSSHQSNRMFILKRQLIIKPIWGKMDSREID